MDPKVYEAVKNGSSLKLSGVDSERQVTCQRNTVLHIAAKFGNKASTEQILTSHPSLVHEINVKGDTPLHIAARLGHVEVAKLLITCAKTQEVESGTHPLRVVNTKKFTVLHEAVRNGHLKVVDLLIEEDPDLAFITDDGVESPMFMAVERGFYEMAVHILEKVPNCSLSGREGMTMMHAAVISLPRIDKLSQRSVRQITNTVFPILQIIIGELIRIIISLPQKLIRNPGIGRTDFVDKTLTKMGPGILEEKDEFGWTPLHYAAYIGDEKVVELFLKKKSSIAYSQNNKGMSALHISAQRGRVGVIRTLIQKCPDVCELLDNNDQTALHVAVENNRKDVVKEFLGMMPFSDLINEPDKEGNTCLHTAAFRGYHFILFILANDNRVDITAINNLGMTAVDIVWSSTQLDADTKGFIISNLKTRGLGMARVYEERRMAQLETSQEKKIKVPPQNDKEAEGENTTGHESEKYLIASTERKIEGPTERNPKEESEYFKNMANVNLIVATIIASITFAAIIQIPGGYQSSNGMPILMKNPSFRIFLVCDSLAFGVSAGLMFIHFLSAFVSRVLSKTYAYPVILIYSLTCLSIVSTVLAFIFAVNAVLSKKVLSMSTVLPYSFSFSRFPDPSGTGFSFFFFPLGAFIVRFTMILIRRSSYDKE
ncbi:hypothetical protein UlMin_006211 [Ulmus minor]